MLYLKFMTSLECRDLFKMQLQVNSTQQRLVAMQAEEHGLIFAALCIFSTLAKLTNHGIPALRKAV